MNQSHADPVARWAAVICSERNTHTHTHTRTHTQRTHTHSARTHSAHTAEQNDEPFFCFAERLGSLRPFFLLGFNQGLFFVIIIIITRRRRRLLRLNWTELTPNYLYLFFYGHFNGTDAGRGREQERARDTERERAEGCSSAGRSVLRTHGTAYRLSCYVLFWVSILPRPPHLPSHPSPLNPPQSSSPPSLFPSAENSCVWA